MFPLQLPDWKEVDFMMATNRGIHRKKAAPGQSLQRKTVVNLCSFAPRATQIYQNVLSCLVLSCFVLSCANLFYLFCFTFFSFFDLIWSYFVFHIILSEYFSGRHMHLLGFNHLQYVNRCVPDSPVCQSYVCLKTSKHTTKQTTNQPTKQTNKQTSKQTNKQKIQHVSVGHHLSRRRSLDFHLLINRLLSFHNEKRSHLA